MEHGKAASLLIRVQSAFHPWLLLASLEPSCANLPVHIPADKGEIRSRKMKGLNHEIHENERTKIGTLIDADLH
jgi:hypothetical protein